jgi:hypothetical protein
MARQRPPDYLPQHVLTREDFADACASRNLGAILGIATRWGGAGFTASHVARRCEMTISQVRDYVVGGRRALSIDIFDRVADGLHIPGQMLGISDRPWERENAADSFSASTAVNVSKQMPDGSPVLGDENGEQSATEEDEEEMERRRLLQSLAALGVTISPLTRALETVRTGFGGPFGYDDRKHLDDWEEMVAGYGYAYLATTPANLIPDLAADLVTVRSIAHPLDKDSPEYRGWCRVGGALSALLAKSLSNLGQSRDARQWWNMAQHVTDASGDTDLSLWIRGERITHGLYEEHPRQTLFRNIAAATELARGRACAGAAHISTSRAQALTLAGSQVAAQEELSRTENILSRLSPEVTEDTASVFGFAEDRLRYTQTWVYAHMGDEDSTDKAGRRACQLYPPADRRTPAQIDLMRAHARIRCGDVSEGIRYAQSVYESLHEDDRTTMINSLAHQVAVSVPREVQDRRDVVNYRALLSSSRKVIGS